MQGIDYYYINHVSQWPRVGILVLAATESTLISSLAGLENGQYNKDHV